MADVLALFVEGNDPSALGLPRIFRREVRVTTVADAIAVAETMGPTIVLLHRLGSNSTRTARALRRRLPGAVIVVFLQGYTETVAQQTVALGADCCIDADGKTDLEALSTATEATARERRRRGPLH